jgi:hypothetical protein
LEQDNKTCIVSPPECVLYHQIVVGNNYRCVSECLSGLVNLTISTCITECSGFTDDLTNNTNTRSCVDDCSSSFADRANYYCLAGCDASKFRNLIQSSTFECLATCPNGIVLEDNLTCNATAIQCIPSSEFKVFVKETTTHYCVEECSSLLVNLPDTCITSCSTFKEDIALKST